MRASVLLLASLVLFHGISDAVAAGLPEESQQIIEKLEAYEVEKSESLDSDLMEERRAMSKEFKEMAVLRTKRGDLDSANLISHFQLMLGDSSKEVSEILNSDLDLPIEAGTLLERLADVERRERTTMQALLDDKRQAVIRILNSHLQEAMRRGDLDGVNSLKEIIRSLKEASLSVVWNSSGGNTEDSRIPDDAVEHDGRHFKIIKMDSSLSWEDAREECQKLGGDLGWAVGSEGEAFLRALFTPFVEVYGHSCVWVGGQRNRSGDWEWLDGTKISDDLWAVGYDLWEDPKNTVMVRWIGSYRAAQVVAKQPRGYLCMWE